MAKLFETVKKGSMLILNGKFNKYFEIYQYLKKIC